MIGLESEGEKLWNKYCSFIYEDFQKQIEYNREETEAYFKKIKNTKLLEAIGAKNAENIRQVPITTYDDYVFLKSFGERVRKLELSIPKKSNETLAEYHIRIGRMAAEPIMDYLPGDFSFYVKTTGTTAYNKWIIHTQLFNEIASETGMSILAIACSERFGTTSLRIGDTLLNIGAPPPYISGWGHHGLAKNLNFRIYPPFEITDKISDIRRRIWIILKKIDKMKEKIAIIAATASILYMLVRYITDRCSFYKNYYEALNLGLTKIYVFLNYVYSKLSWKVKSIEEVLPVKGLICSGYDSRIYYKLIENNFRVKPLNMYASSEFGFPMYGTVENKYNMILDLRTGYFEFIHTKTGEVFKVDELKKGESYSLIGTPFGGSIVRYRIGDIFRVEEIRDDGMPIFSFEGREGYVIDIYDYFRINEDLATRVMMRSGLISSENWCFAKLMDPSEHLCILMEKEHDYSENIAEEKIFRALIEESPDFRDFVRDFKIKNAADIIKVEFLRKGAFIRYFELRLKSGVPYGQIKPPKIIPSHKMEIFETLRGI